MGLLTLAVSVSETGAEEFRYRVRPQDTASRLAAHFYNAEWKMVYILTRNGLQDDTLTAGRRIVLPSSRLYSARSGDSTASIAKRYMGDVDRRNALIRFNRLNERRSLKVGQQLLLPFHLRHTVRAGESLGKLARTYYRTNKLSSMLKEYNQLKDWKLKTGQRLTIPIFDRATLGIDEKPLPPEVVPDESVTVRSVVIEEPTVKRGGDFDEEEDPPLASADANARENVTSSAPPSEQIVTNDEPELDLTTLRSTIDAYQKGFFHQACKRFETMLDGPRLGPTERGRIIRYLAFCSVAFDDEQAARDYFRSWLLTTADAKLDRRSTSPKILVIFDETVKAIRGSR